MVTHLVTPVTVLLCSIPHLILHETGHVVAAVAVGSRVKAVGLGWAGPYVCRTSAKTGVRNAVVALSGPLFNLVTALLMLWFSIPGAWVPLFIGMFNLMPMPASDGLRAMQYLRERKA